jgi:hypothetical protein
MIAPLRRKVAQSDAPSPERRTLADKLAKNVAEDARSMALATAAATAGDAVLALQVAVDQAEAAVRDAPAAAADFLVAKAMGTAGAPPLTTAQARAALAEANDNLAAARSARDRLEAEAHQNSGGWPARDEAMAVLRAESTPSVDALLSDLERLTVELAIRAGELHWLAQNRFFPLGPFGIPDNHDVVRLMNRLTAPQTAWDLTEQALIGRERWGGVVDKLLQDAGAAVPT